jgi:hypothetical protein
LLRCYLQEPDKISNGFKRFNRGFIVGAIFFAGMTIVGSQTGAAEPVANSIRRACAPGGLCWALGIGRQLSAMCGVD